MACAMHSIREWPRVCEESVMALLEVDNLQTPFSYPRGHQPGGRRRLLPRQRRRDAGDRRRVRLRQIRHLDVADAVDTRAAWQNCRFDPLPGQGFAKTLRTRDARDPRQRHLDDLSGADDEPQPGADGRPPDRRDAAAASGAGQAGGRSARHRDADIGGHSPSRHVACANIRISSRAACASAS